MIAAGLTLGVGSAVAISGGYALQHREAAALPPLSLARPLRSLAALFRRPLWLGGFAAGIGGWALYVAALALAPLSLVQACAAGGVGLLALGLPRLSRLELVGVAAALAGLVLLASTLGSSTTGNRGDELAIAVWIAISVGGAGAVRALVGTGAGLATAAGILYAAGDVATKGAVGGAGVVFVPILFACHGLAFVALQLAFQRGGRLATAGLAVLWTNALPILAGTILFAEGLPPGWGGPARVAAFVLVVVGAVALARRVEPSPSD
jgi:hypothetical protein